MNSNLWLNRFRFYFAAMGLGFGLGNLWRFPYVVYENGGGAFTLLYIFFTFIVGIPLLCGELLIGKIHKKSMLGTFDKISTQGTRFWSVDKSEATWEKMLLKIIAWSSVFVCILVLSYFAVISGWVLYYFFQFLVGMFSDDFEKVTILSSLRQNGMLQILLAAVHMLIVTTFVARDKKPQKETWVGYLMPLFGVLVIVLAFKALSLEKATEAFKYLFYPDFSQLSISSPAAALGHLLFTLSLGLGAIITFGNYLPSTTYVPRASMQVATVDMLISFFAGLLIFPMVMSTMTHYSGPELLFQTVPILFGQISNGDLYGTLFFFCLYVAAIGSSIGLVETVAENVQPKIKKTKTLTIVLVGLISLIVACIPAFSSSFFSHVLADRGGLLRLWDMFLLNWILPILALVVSQVVVYKMDSDEVEAEFNQSKSPLYHTLYNHWRFVMKWLIPLVVIVCLALQTIGLFS